MKRILLRSVIAIILILGIFLYMQVLLLYSGDNTLPVRNGMYKKTFNAENHESVRTITTANPPPITKRRTRLQKPAKSSKRGDNRVAFEDISNRKEYIQSFVDTFEHNAKLGLNPPEWQKELFSRTKNNLPIKKTSYFLSHLLMVRIYESDKAKWTYRELKQWLHYMLLIGVEHFYVCEHYHEGDEDMVQNLEQYISLGYVTFIRIHTQKAMAAQVECYKRWVREVGKYSAWMTSVDMDEYPFHLQDKQENFLRRYLAKMEAKNPDVGEISMHNYLMLGQGDRSKNITIDRIRRSTPKNANALVKPLFRPAYVRPDIHHGSVMHPKIPLYADPAELRMLHYWGARMQEWGPDTPKVINMTITYNDMAETWVDRLRNSLLTFGEDDSFSSATGP